MRKILFGIMLIALVFAVGCAKPPEQAMAAAKAAIEQAKQAEADAYAPDSLKAAEDLQGQLDAEIKLQADKFALFRNYKKAEELCASIKTAGEKALADAKEQKEKVKNEAKALIEECKAGLTEAEEMLAKAPKGKGTQQDLEALKGDLTGAKTSLGEAETAFNGERFLDAKAKAEAVKNTVGNVKNAIQQAIEAKKGGKKAVKK